MATKTKVWLIIAAACIVLGCGLFAIVMTALDWDFTRLSTAKYETNTYNITEAFDGISVNTDTADIVFALSEDGECRIVCLEEKNAKHSVKVKDGTLSVDLTDERTVYDFIGLHFGTTRITLYLPKTEFDSLFIKESTGDIDIPESFTFSTADISLSTGDVLFCASASGSVKIKASTGDIRVENVSAGSLDVSVSTGKVTASEVDCEGDVTVGVSTGKVMLTDITCKNLTSNGSTGDIILDGVIAEKKLSVKRSTGDILFNGSDAAEIFVTADTGDVTGTLLTEKVFITETSTGSIDVPKSVTGGRCEIKTATGDIKIEIS